LPWQQSAFFIYRQNEMTIKDVVITSDGKTFWIISPNALKVAQSIGYHEATKEEIGTFIDVLAYQEQ